MFKKKFWLNLWPALTIVLVLFMFGAFLSFSDAAVNKPLTVQRGGTGVNTVGVGQILVGQSINSMVATSSISIDMDTGAVSIGNVSINAATPGDFIVHGKIGAGTTTPQTKLDVFGILRIYPPVGSATTTCSDLIAGALMYSTTSSTWKGCNGSAWVGFTND